MESYSRPVVGWDETERQWYVRLSDGSVVNKTELESFLAILDERIRDVSNFIRVALHPGSDSAVGGNRGGVGDLGHETS